MPQQPKEEKIFLICTVGSSTEAVEASIKKWRPDRLKLVTTALVRGDAEVILSQADDPPGTVPAAKNGAEFLELTNGEDAERCVAELAALMGEVRAWQAGGAGRRTVVDITGGTKCMSAALGIVASRLDCTFSYVGGAGGAKSRDRGGVGDVQTGQERVFFQSNPWKALGFQELAEATLLFNERQYAAAADRLKRFYSRLPEGAERKRLESVFFIADGYARWDRFDHKGAARMLGQALGREAQLVELFASAAGLLGEKLGRHVDFLGLVEAGSGAASRMAVVRDLVGNAGRCAAGGRFDDAVARLYRATEALAQAWLLERGLNSAAVKVEDLPEGLRKKWRPRLQGVADGAMLGLMDDYRLLQDLGAKEGKLFFRLRLAGAGQPLDGRNNSILAHGFKAVGKETYEGLRRKLLELMGEDGGEIPEFPLLPVGLEVVGGVGLIRSGDEGGRQWVVAAAQCAPAK